jgi:hypothetical protein
MIVIGLAAMIRFVIALADQPSGAEFSISIAPIDIVGVVLLVIGLNLGTGDTNRAPVPPPRPDAPPSDVEDLE